MCIAIVKPKGISISKEILQTCANANKDGCGMAYIDDNGVVNIYKCLDFDMFYNKYIEVENKSTMIIHFRIATHGEVSPENCHPFKLNNRMALIHNGVISGYGDKKTKTDTQDFIDKVIGNISWKEWKNPSFRTLVGEAIGYSKLAILDKSGNYYIVNEERGMWDNGVWYSNSSYKPKVITKNEYKKDTSYSYQQKLVDNKDYVYDTYDDSYYPVYECVFRCEKCGHEFIQEWKEEDYTLCTKCKDFAEIVGWIEDGKKIYFDEEDNKYDKQLAKTN